MKLGKPTVSAAAIQCGQACLQQPGGTCCGAKSRLRASSMLAEVYFHEKSNISERGSTDCKAMETFLRAGSPS